MNGESEELTIIGENFVIITDEFVGEVYPFESNELSDMRTLQYQKYRLNI